MSIFPRSDRPDTILPLVLRLPNCKFRVVVVADDSRLSRQRIAYEERRRDELCRTLESGNYSTQLIATRGENSRTSFRLSRDSKTPRGWKSKWNFEPSTLSLKRTRTCRMWRRNPLGGTKKLSRIHREPNGCSSPLSFSPSSFSLSLSLVRPLKKSCEFLCSKCIGGRWFLYGKNRPARSKTIQRSNYQDAITCKSKCYSKMLEMKPLAFIYERYIA